MFSFLIAKSSKESGSVKRKREHEEDEDAGTVLEMKENLDNPLRCPVRLYEFYISKWCHCFILYTNDLNSESCHELRKVI